MPTTTQEDLDDLYSWTRIVTDRDDNDVILTRQIDYDNGITKNEEYDNGLLRFAVSRDGDGSNGLPSVKPWETVEVFYTAEGTVQARVVTYDDGTTNIKQYENGILRMVTQTDLTVNGETSDVKSWETIETFYNDSGEKEAKLRIDDDGVNTLNLYEAGVLRSVLQTDLTEYGEASDARSWESIETFYTETGEREAQLRKDDDGVTTLKLYEEGQLRSILQEDITDYGEPTDARSWTSIETFYDADGNREARLQINDNGVQIVNEYENNVLRVSTETDLGQMGEPSSVKPWESITTFYTEEGQRAARETIYDNADVTANFYEEGTRSLRLDYDGDDSNSWLVRETIYDDAGQVDVVNTYDTAADVPPDYGFLSPA